MTDGTGSSRRRRNAPRSRRRTITPEDLAALHPRLYHLTDPDALPGILRHGLLPTSRLLGLFGVTGEARAALERRPRPESVRMEHPVHGEVTIMDNKPLDAAKLARCLDGGLTTEDWMLLLNARVFLWPDERRLGALRGAALNRGRARLVLVLDTLSVARACAGRVEIAPFNTGSTLYVPARRGPDTFQPLEAWDHATWRSLRMRRGAKKGMDDIGEVTVVGGIANVGDHLVNHHLVGGGAAA